MAFTILEQSDRFMRFVARDVDVGIVNAIRRVILSEVDNTAIAFDPYIEEKSDITFIENTTSLHNEFLGHRISLIPIQIEPNEIKTYNREMYKFVIQKSNTSNEVIDVTTDDITVFDEDGNDVSDETRDIIFPKDTITNDPILVTRLKPNLYNNAMGEKLHVEFRARVGKAVQHARWSPVSTCTYFNVIDDEKADEAFSKSSASMTPQERELAKKRFDIHGRYRYFIKNEYDEPSAFEFTIESECRWTPKMLVSEAIRVLIDKLQKLVFEPERCKVDAIDEETHTYAVIVSNEDHTLGNLMQTLLYNEYVRSNKKDVLSYVGYYQPHPLNAEIVFKLVFKEATDPIEFLNGAIEGPLIDAMTSLLDVWEQTNLEVKRSKSKTEEKPLRKIKKATKDPEGTKEKKEVKPKRRTEKEPEKEPEKDDDEEKEVPVVKPKRRTKKDPEPEKDDEEKEVEPVVKPKRRTKKDQEPEKDDEEKEPEKKPKKITKKKKSQEDK